MNEEGLVANLLYLAENDFGNVTDSDRPRLSFAAWTLYLLSQFSNVNEVVADVQKDAIQIVPINFGPGGAAHTTVHMTVSDASGDSAVIEYLDASALIIVEIAARRVRNTVISVQRIMGQRKPTTLMSVVDTILTEVGSSIKRVSPMEQPTENSLSPEDNQDRRYKHSAAVSRYLWCRRYHWTCVAILTIRRRHAM
jgi:hypothetical protein